jgi:hypothetical protein
MIETILLGIVKADHNGQKRLQRALAEFKPEIIALDGTPQVIGANIKAGLTLLESFKKMDRSKFSSQEQYAYLEQGILSLNYELLVPKQYKKDNQGTRLCCLGNEVDSIVPDLFYLKDKEWSDLQSKGNSNITYNSITLVPFSEYPSEQVHSQRVQARYFSGSIEDYLEIYGVDLFEELVIKRSQNLASKILALRSENPNKKLVAILDNFFIFSDYAKNVYNLLEKKIDVRRYSLNSFDSLPEIKETTVIS